MNKKYMLLALLLGTLLTLTLTLTGYGFYTLGMKAGSRATEAPTLVKSDTTAPEPGGGRKILYYHDPMVPNKRFDKPGKSPFMDMMLVPVYADDNGDQGTVSVSSRAQQSLGVRTALVTSGVLSEQVSAVGNIAFNERDQAIVQARATGFVERLRVRATLDPVVKGQPLVDLYVPDWVAVQEEFLALKRMHGDDLSSLVDAARQRMRQAGMDDQQIRTVESSGTSQSRFTIFAPLSGVVAELLVRDGMTVAAGSTLFRINGLTTVWANAEVPESQAAALRPGVRVQARSPGVPGVSYEGEVQTILPDVSATTRTLKARVQLLNKNLRLVPGMLVTMQLMGADSKPLLLVPSEAVIRTGKRSVVMLAEDGGRFRSVEVEAGAESGGQTEIKSGLAANQRVVVSSQFLIDSEASLKGFEARSNPAPAAGQNDSTSASRANPPPTPPRHLGHARIEAIGKDAITLSHEPIPSIKWGAMTMEFKAPPPKELTPDLKIGERVDFEFFINDEGSPELTRVSPEASLPTPPAPPEAKK